MKKLLTVLLSVMMVCCLCACSSEKKEEKENTKTYKVGICNYVDDASLNQIVENIQSELEAKGSELGVTFDVAYDNGNADANIINQIISNFISNECDLLVGVATPTAMMMQAATEELPIVFAAVSDPLAAGLVATLEAPGANITGTSDFLDTNAVMNLIFALNPEADYVGLLYDQGQDSSKTAIAEAKAYLDAKNIKYIEKTGTNVNEIEMAAKALAEAGVDAVFTPSDNTVMKAELSIYEILAEAGIPHYAGADSFALNGAFVGYGVDYANLGKVTGDIIADILVNGKDTASYGVVTFDNGTATVNTEICEKLGYNYEDVVKAFEPYCTKVVEIQTAESFN